MLNFTLTHPEDLADDERWETVEFRQSRRDAWRSAFISGAALGIGLLALFVDTGFGNGSLAVGMGGVMVLSLVTVMFIIVARHPPVQLRVGPSGIQHTLWMRRPASWLEVRTVTATRPRRVLFRRVSWLHVRLTPGNHNGMYRSWVRGPLRWIARRRCTNIPLHGLRGNEDTIIGSVERFKAVHPH